jgi:nitroreductase
MNPTLAIKEARTDLDVHPLIKQRFSPRAFTSEALTEEELLTLFEAASWAPSSMNEQPWRFRYAHRGSAGFDSLGSTLSSGNQPWATNGAAIIAISAITHHQRNGAPNASWQFDAGLAVGNLLLQATSMGLHGHILGGFDHDAAIKLLGLDTGKEAIIGMLVLGRLGAAESLPEPYLSRERTPRSRKPLSESAMPILT